MQIKSIKSVKNLKDKRVLLRVDYNLPFDGGDINFKENTRIKASLETIKFLLKEGANIILISHLDRPDNWDMEYTLKPIAKYLEKLLKQKVVFLENNILKEIPKINKGIYMLENIRFYKEEYENDKKFAKKLASLGDLYVNDAFSVSHRSESSMSAITDFLPSYAGIFLEKELNNLSSICSGNIKKNNRPYVAIVGGAKISTKINLIDNLLKTADKVLLGGALIIEVLRHKGINIDGSLTSSAVSKKYLDKLLKNKKLLLPVDVIVGCSNEDKYAKVVRLDKLKKVCQFGEYILDIGPETIRNFSAEIKKAQTIVWNGPMGYFESPLFAYGTKSIAQVIAMRGKGKAYAVVGGGETVTALNQIKMAKYVDWVSTGGGAMLAFLGGEKMPGLKKICSK